MLNVSQYQREKYKNLNEHRPFCYKCWKAESLCLCGIMPKLDSIIRIAILQHPNERFMPINTARFTHLSLSNSVIFHGVNFNRNKAFMDDFKQFNPEKIGLLFPSPLAKDLSEAPEDLSNLYVVDGTWNEARKIVFNSHILHEIPHYTFNPKVESTYRIRREPKKNFVSTVEAVVMSLRILEKNSNSYTELLEVFDTMVENQLHYINNKSSRKS